jgi:hypothetical protein
MRIILDKHSSLTDLTQRSSAIAQDPTFLHGHVAGHLLHPWLVGLNRDPSDVHSAALKMNEKQHVVGYQPA